MRNLWADFAMTFDETTNEPRPTFRGEPIPHAREVVCDYWSEGVPSVRVVLKPRKTRRYAKGEAGRLAVLIALMRSAGATIDEGTTRRPSGYVLTRLHAAGDNGETMGGRSCRTFGRAKIVSRREFSRTPLVDRCTFCEKKFRSAAKS